MEIKKNPSANLEKKRATHIQVGLILALSLILVSLEWATPDNNQEILPGIYPGSRAEIDLMPVIPRKEPPRQVLPALKIPVPVDENLPEDIFKINEIFDPEAYNRPYDIWIPSTDSDEDPIVEPLNEIDVQIMAKFPGGQDAMMKWIYSNITYPAECVENGVQGRVTAKFTISKFGEVMDIRIVRSVHPALDAEVVRVLQMMPKFSPAIQNQQLVPVYMYWPVIFKLN